MKGPYLTCMDCGLPDNYDGQGDGIGSCDCPRCDFCGEPPGCCDCCDDPYCCAQPDDDAGHGDLRPVVTVDTGGFT